MTKKQNIYIISKNTTIIFDGLENKINIDANNKDAVIYNDLNMYDEYNEIYKNLLYSTEFETIENDLSIINSGLQTILNVIKIGTVSSPHTVEIIKKIQSLNFLEAKTLINSKNLFLNKTKSHTNYMEILNLKKEIDSNLNIIKKEFENEILLYTLKHENIEKIKKQIENIYHTYFSIYLKYRKINTKSIKRNFINSSVFLIYRKKILNYKTIHPIFNYAIYESELNKEDKNDFPKYIIEDHYNINKALRNKNKIGILGASFSKELELRKHPVKMNGGIELDYHSIISNIYKLIVCIQTINYLNEKNKQKNGKSLQKIGENNEKTALYFEKKSINSIISLIIVDLCLNYLNNTKTKKENTINIKGFNSSGSHINKECLNDFKNTVFDLTDMFASLFLFNNENEFPIYLTKDKGNVFFHNLYEIKNIENTINIKNIENAHSFINKVQLTETFESIILNKKINIPKIPCTSKTQIKIANEILELKEPIKIINYILGLSSIQNIGDFSTQINIEDFYIKYKKMINKFLNQNKMENIEKIAKGWIEIYCTERTYLNIIIEKLHSLYIRYIEIKLAEELMHILKEI